MDYLFALHYAARREDPSDVLRRLERLQRVASEAMTGKRRRQLTRRMDALRRRLDIAVEFSEFDWAGGEAWFVEWVRGGANVDGVYERWRASGVPASVLRRAGLRPSSGLSRSAAMR